MTSLLLGVCCVYLAFIILRMPEERFEQELDEITRRGHTSRYYRLMRCLVWALGMTGGAIIVLRFF